MFRLIILSTIALSLIGCKSDPYDEKQLVNPGEEVVDLNNLQGPPPTPPQPDAVKDLLGISADEYHVVNEGDTVRVPFKIAVDEGQAVLTIEGLETMPGARYEVDKDGNEFVVWQPGFKAANDPTELDPTVNTRFYSFKIFVTSSVKENNSRERVIGITVKNTRRRSEIVPGDSLTGSSTTQLRLREGEKTVASFEVIDPDFPNGPFEFYSEAYDFPAVITKDPNSDTKFLITVEPGFDAVKLTGNGSNCGPTSCEVKYPKNFYVRSPDGYIATKEVELRIRDIRQDPVIIVPDTISQAGEVSFNVDVIDPNGEVQPELVLVNENITYGSDAKLLRLKDAASASEYRESKVLKIEDITQEFEGKSDFLKFEACVLGNGKDMNRCSDKVVKVTYDKRARRPPVINRDAWNFEDIIYIKKFDTREITLPIAVLEDDDEIVSWEITRNKNSTSNVSWRNNKLRITSMDIGLQYFTLKATSRFGMTATESFVFEGLPLDWEKNLYIGESHNDSDLNLLSKVSSSIKIVNPAIMSLNERLYEQRDLLVVGTGILKDKKLSERLVEMTKTIKDVLIMSPKLDNLPKPILDELEKYDVVLSGKLSEQQTTVPLNQLKLLVPNAIDLQKPVGTVTLKGTTTDFSKDPMTIVVGDLAEGTCSTLMILRETILNSYKVAIQCKRENGGIFTLVGFEPEDVLMNDVEDKDINFSWVKTLMSRKNLVTIPSN